MSEKIKEQSYQKLYENLAFYSIMAVLSIMVIGIFATAVVLEHGDKSIVIHSAVVFISVVINTRCSAKLLEVVTELGRRRDLQSTSATSREQP